jgi:UDP-N-acetylglucosamine transferase subunit ALG13
VNGPAKTVLVSVGTDHHPFDRVVRWVDGWLGAQAQDEIDCLVQYGASCAPRRARGVPFLGHVQLHETMAGASVVVCHGGPSTIAEARRHGHRPIVVPRDPTLGEHVDDHQQRFARRLVELSLVQLITSREDLACALDDALASSGPRTPGASVLVQPPAAEAALRFGALVDALFTQRRR